MSGDARAQWDVTGHPLLGLRWGVFYVKSRVNFGREAEGCVGGS